MNHFILEINEFLKSFLFFKMRFLCIVLLLFATITVIECETEMHIFQSKENNLFFQQNLENVVSVGKIDIESGDVSFQEYHYNFEQGVGVRCNSTLFSIHSFSVDRKIKFGLVGINVDLNTTEVYYSLPFISIEGILGLGNTLTRLPELEDKCQMFLTGRGEDNSHWLYSFDVEKNELKSVLSFNDSHSLGENLVVNSFFLDNSSLLLFLNGYIYIVDVSLPKISSSIPSNNIITLSPFYREGRGMEVYGLEYSDRTFSLIQFLPYIRLKVFYDVEDVVISVSLIQDGMMYFICRKITFPSFGMCLLDLTIPISEMEVKVLYLCDGECLSFLI